MSGLDAEFEASNQQMASDFDFDTAASTPSGYEGMKIAKLKPAPAVQSSRNAQTINPQRTNLSPTELVESGFSEEQFFAVARDLVNGLQTVALNANRKPIVRAMAMSVFRACFDTLEMVMEDHKVAVKGFLDEALKGWMPFFVDTIKLVLPEPPAEVDETKEEGLPSQWRGLIALKLQVVKV